MYDMTSISMPRVTFCLDDYTDFRYYYYLPAYQVNTIDFPLWATVQTFPSVGTKVVRVHTPSDIYVYAPSTNSIILDGKASTQ